MTSTTIDQIRTCRGDSLADALTIVFGCAADLRFDAVKFGALVSAYADKVSSLRGLTVGVPYASMDFAKIAESQAAIKRAATDVAGGAIMFQMCAARAKSADALNASKVILNAVRY